MLIFFRIGEGFNFAIWRGTGLIYCVSIGYNFLAGSWRKTTGHGSQRTIHGVDGQVMAGCVSRFRSFEK
jgi:hypothetical protein